MVIAGVREGKSPTLDDGKTIPPRGLKQSCDTTHKKHGRNQPTQFRRFIIQAKGFRHDQGYSHCRPKHGQIVLKTQCNGFPSGRNIINFIKEFRTESGVVAIITSREKAPVRATPHFITEKSLRARKSRRDPFIQEWIPLFHRSLWVSGSKGATMTSESPQYHIACKSGDVGAYVLLPGSPNRCPKKSPHTLIILSKSPIIENTA